MSDLYDEDILLWSERQSTLLRRIAAGEPVNERPDWANIIEEVESVGREQSARGASRCCSRPSCTCSRRRPGRTPATSRPGTADARLFRVQARDGFSPSMRQRLDVAHIYADALTVLACMMDGQPPQPVAAACPMTLDELLGV